MTNLSQNDSIEIRFVGGGIALGKLRASELADVLKAAETLIQSSVLSTHQDLTKDDIFLALTDVRDGSVGLQFKPTLPQIVLPEYERIAELISYARYDMLPPEANDALRRIATFARKNHCTAELRTSTSSHALAVVDQDMYIPDSPRMLMRTTIYGQVVEAGGKNPNVHIETLQGQIVVCAGDQDQVKKLAEQLYEMVGIVGRANYNVTSSELTNFTIHEVLPYVATSFTTALRELGEAAAPYFGDIDVDTFVHSIRADGTED